MELYLIPIGLVVGIGLIAGVILTLAAKFMAVEVNPLTAAVREVLPGANCGACGYAGCDDYAVALTNDSFVKSNLCTPGGSEVALNISAALGIPFDAVASKYAIVRCSGTTDKTTYVMDFQGIQNCNANKMFYRGRGACQYACLGYGDCVAVCEYGAIEVINGVAVVDKMACVGCGLCAKRCPNQLIEIVNCNQNVFVGCISQNTGAKTRTLCKAGCIACKKCEKVCDFDAIKVENNVAYIDGEKCTNCGACVAACPVKVIHTTGPVTQTETVAS